jgi:hypothetical protein
MLHCLPAPLTIVITTGTNPKVVSLRVTGKPFGWSYTHISNVDDEY